MTTAPRASASEREEHPLLDFCRDVQRRHESRSTLEARKAKGQVFTPPSVARFMAGLIEDVPAEFSLLDPGAGLGMLTAAVCGRVTASRAPRRLSACLFETDETILPGLERVMEFCGETMRAAGHSFAYRIVPRDFILDGPEGASGRSALFGRGETFDAVVMNPPYFKVGVDSPHSKAMSDVIRLHTNIYPLFMAKAVDALKEDGELVAVTPRSFCNGLYFRDFRRWFLSHVDLRRVHLFGCRRSTFDDVLQESVVTHARKTKRRSDVIDVSTTRGRRIPDDLEVVPLPRDRVLKTEGRDTLVYIPASARDAEILAVTDAWPERFSDSPLRVSTGPVVTFRTREFLAPRADADDSAPLIAPHNVKPFKTEWPLERKNKPTAFVVTSESRKHLIPNGNYVLLRRFTAKEEKRRLVASCFLANESASPFVAVENHVNYVYHADRDLTADETYGIAAVFNSTLFDAYFRMLSGSTQVNATEIRTMRFPGLELVAAVGRRVRALPSLTPPEAERIVLDELGVDEDFGRRFQDDLT